ncbi:MAG: DUF4340 domain-containing protein [Eubacteriales bacterium]|nr:DUF4340 domain-containing protein [Eubacteriales bacterium]
MKKKLRALYILIALAVVFGAGTAVLHISPSAAETESTESADIPCVITDIPVSMISAVAVTNSECSLGLLPMGENVELVLADETGQLVASDAQFSQSEARSMVYMLCHMSGTKELGTPKDKDEYGYSSPNANLTFILSDKTQREFLLGSETAGGRGYYLFDLAADKLYIVKNDTAALLLRTPKDFISHSIFPTVPTDEYTAVEEISFERDGESFVIKNENGEFFLTSPIYQRVRSYNVYSSIVVPLGGIYADKCLAAGEDLADYGFENAGMKVSMTVKGERYTAWFLSGEGTLLMADPEKGNVFEINAELLKLLPENYMSLLDGKPYYYSLGDCTSLRAVSDRFDLCFDFSGSGKDITAKCGDRTLTGDEVSALSQSVNGVEIAERFSGKAEGEPILTLSFTLNSGKTEKVSLVETGGKTVCEVNGTVNFTASPLSVSDLVSALAQYCEEQRGE